MTMDTEHGSLRSLSEPEMYALLEGKCIGHLGCTDKDEVYVVPITYAFADGYIYAHSVMGHKIRLMREHKKICVQVEEIQDMFHWQSVLAWGSYEELKSEDAAKAMRLLIHAIARTRALKVSDLEADFAALAVNAIFYRIKVERMTGRAEAKPRL